MENNTNKSDKLFTCITCRVGFREAEAQRCHYKSDWHRYNLKRKVVDLGPVTAENFEERLATQEAKQADASAASWYCSTCRKSYGNHRAFTNHSKSKKHLQCSAGCNTGSENVDAILGNELELRNVFERETLKSGKKFPIPLQIAGVVHRNKTNAVAEIASDEDDDWEEVEEIPIPVNRCLFCEAEADGYESNLVHMSCEHSFFIPDLEYCGNVEGLLEYLGAKIGEGMMCLWCNEKGKQFYDVKSVQQHMQDKGHCKMLHEGDAAMEYADFYDYSSSYPDGADVNPDEIYQPDSLYFNDRMQLVLPSGVTLGHRALKIYYKQYVRPGAQLAIPRAGGRNKVLSGYRAIGYGTTTLAEAQRKHHAQKSFIHARDKYYMKLGIHGNKTTQHHFRAQVQY